MWMLLFVALLLAIPTYGLSFLPILGALALRAWTDRATQERQPAPTPPVAQPSAPRPAPKQIAAVPSWAKDATGVERFKSDLLVALPSRGVPSPYVSAIFSREETARLCLASVQTAEENGRDFYRQCFAAADFIVRQWNSLHPAEQKKFCDRHF